MRSFSILKYVILLYAPYTFRIRFAPHLPPVVPSILPTFRKNAPLFFVQLVPCFACFYRWTVPKRGPTLATLLQPSVRCQKAALSLRTLRTFNRFFLQSMKCTHVASYANTVRVSITLSTQGRHTRPGQPGLCTAWNM